MFFLRRFLISISLALDSSSLLRILCSSLQDRFSIAHSRQIRVIYHPDPIRITSFRPNLVRFLSVSASFSSLRISPKVSVVLGNILPSLLDILIFSDTYDVKERRIENGSRMLRRHIRGCSRLEILPSYLCMCARTCGTFV